MSHELEDRMALVGLLNNLKNDVSEAISDVFKFGNHFDEPEAQEALNSLQDVIHSTNGLKKIITDYHPNLNS